MAVRIQRCRTYRWIDIDEGEQVPRTLGRMESALEFSVHTVAEEAAGAEGASGHRSALLWRAIAEPAD